MIAVAVVVVVLAVAAVVLSFSRLFIFVRVATRAELASLARALRSLKARMVHILMIL